MAVFQLSTIIGWKRNGVIVFSKICKRWNCCILFESLITNPKKFIEFSKDLQSNYFALRCSDALKWDCLYTIFLLYSKANIFYYVNYFLENVDYLICKIIFRCFSFALFELGDHLHKKKWAFLYSPSHVNFGWVVLKKGKF